MPRSHSGATMGIHNWTLASDLSSRWKGTGMTARKRVQKIKSHSSAPAPATAPGENTQERAFPIVGIGASAGGLAAFEAFFSSLTVEPGMAFVLVQHLAPDYTSILSDLIRRYTRLSVFEAENGMTVQRNCTYVIPPNRDMELLNGALRLQEPSEPRGHRLPIDFFFRSLAQDQRERAIGIVLSGTGSDGTLGVRAIKGEGGMIMAQDPDSCEFDGMPRSAIATGLVDYEVPPAEMPARLSAYADYAFGKNGHLTAPSPKAESAVKKIFSLLRSQTGHDFSEYKPNTIHRQIARRMAVQQIEKMDSYIDFLRQTPAEVEALFLNFLIGVTSFFRDPGAFKAIEEQIIPKIFADKPAMDGLIRVWSAGCSTGEEAYSIAILLQERMEALKQNHTMQVFATDIDNRTIATARAGYYPASIAADISPQRLARFFTPEPDGSAYRIQKNIRDMLVFSKQDVIKDPPFSKLDLICCRNLLIYFGAELQKKLIPLFHYALNPGGTLFLGTAEGVGEFADLFALVDRKAKLYQRKENIHGGPRVATLRFTPPMTPMHPAQPRGNGNGKTVFSAKLPLRELTEQALLQQIAPAGALVNAQGDIFYLHGRSGMYLEPTPGETGTNNILKMAREGLRRALGIALHKAARTHEIVRDLNLRVKTNGHFTRVNLSIRPVTTGAAATTESPLYLVILEEPSALDPEQAQQVAPQSAGTGANDLVSDADARIAALEEKLRAREEYLQSTHEELESANEELKSSNEEMQSVNEELQSTNEELETSKEELQSVNEELATVNTESQNKVNDLSRANNDMSNLLAGTGIATVFVDHQLRILRFTPAAGEIINLIQSDVGRPVGHIVSNLVNYDRLVADATDVLATLMPKEAKVQSTAGRWYVMRVRPYRTLSNVIEGVVITFVDITEMKQIEDALEREGTKLLRLSVVVRDAHDAITLQDLQGRILAWNPGAERMYGWSEAEALLMNVRDRIPPELQEDAVAKLLQLSQAEILSPYRTQRISKSGVIVEAWITATALLNQAGQIYAISTTERAAQSSTKP
jgi:two-component system CheB/CheR fusion protein